MEFHGSPFDHQVMFSGETQPQGLEEIAGNGAQKKVIWYISAIDEGTTIILIHGEDGSAALSDGRSTMDGYIYRDENEKWGCLVDGIYLMHAGKSQNNEDLKGQLQKKSLRMETVEEYANYVRDYYFLTNDQVSSAYIFGKDITGRRTFYADHKVSKEVFRQFVTMGGGAECAEKKIAEFIPERTRLTREQAINVAEVAMVHACLNCQCTGGHLTVQFLPTNPETDRLREETTDLNLYMKHFDSFGESNSKSIFVIIPRMPRMDRERIQSIICILFYDAYTPDEETALVQQGKLYVDEFHKPGDPFQFFRATLENASERNRVLGDDPRDLQPPDNRFQHPHVQSFKKVKAYQYKYIGIAAAEYIALVDYATG